MNPGGDPGRSGSPAPSAISTPPDAAHPAGPAHRPPADGASPPHDGPGPDFRPPAGGVGGPVADGAGEGARKAAAVEGRRRLHPLTPLLKGAKFLFAAVAAISWQGYAQLGTLVFLALVGVLLVLGVGLSAVSWLVTGFHVVGRELRVYEGLVWRRTRAIPLERVQAVDVVRPLLARMTGVAELRLEVIGAAKTEAPLAYLGVEEAHALRARLLAGAGHAPAHDPAAPAAGPERPFHVVPNQRVLVANLLSSPVLLLPVALAVTLLPVLFDPPAWTAIGVASMATALLGVVLPPVRRVLNDWDFRIFVDPSGVRLTHGLLDTRSRTVPAHRALAVAVVRPLLWRPLKWWRAKLDVAGVGAEAGEQGVRGGVLVPVADRATVRTVAGRVIDGLDIDALPLRPVPAVARWVSPLAYRRRAFGWTESVVVARDGWLTERLIVARLARVQSVRVVQGPIQRRLGLADVHVDTAGSIHVTARDRAVAEAYASAATLAELARAARTAT
ncbi:membrane protein [Virgisporangium aliadipatigenens]|uniref:Membrane protein n=1 Tax=Virgisporangium aliadipatigenens TaxID=741659 RepID=A0A8J4DSR0_9ACTN|nr:PH domain-containing protein [Virgisporangium aliadipatigenens]GIJ47487.1 membrane protein [Virgisporangium aliadipatigenens]